MTAGTAKRRALRGLEDVPEVETEALVFTHSVCQHAVKLGEIVAVYGPAGSGKTFAVDSFVRRYQHDHPDINVAWVDVPLNPRGKHLPEALLNAVTDGMWDDGPERRLTDQLVEALSDDDWLVVIDEAHALRSSGLHQLKHVYDRVSIRNSDGATGFILVGGAALPEVLALDDQLQSRVAVRAPFDTFVHDTELLPMLNGYHEVFANTADELLLALDDECAHGNWRRWARLLQFALAGPGGPHERFDEALASAAVAAITGRQ